MRRRTLLTTAAGSLASIAGCSSTSDGTPSTEASNDGLPLNVEIDTVNHVVKTYEASRRIKRDDIVAEDELPSVLHDALIEARNGEFETNSVSDELLVAIDEFRKYDNTYFQPYVRLDGTAYIFEPSMPIFSAELGDDAVEEYNSERVAQDDDDFESDAVSSFVHALTEGGPEIPRDEYRVSMVPESVEAFLDEYDYIEDHHGVSRIETEWLDADPPHMIELREMTDEDKWRQPVVDEDTIDDDLRNLFVTAIESNHRAPTTSSPTRSQYFTDDVPEMYFENYSAPDNPYFRLNDTVYNISISSSDYEEGPATVAVDELPAPETNGKRQFRLTVTASTDHTEVEVEEGKSVEIRSRGASPDILWILHEGERHLLESNAYDSERWRDVPDDLEVTTRTTNQETAYLKVGKERSAVYTVPAELPAGTYESIGYFHVAWRDPNTERFGVERAFYPFRLVVTVKSS